MSVCIYIYYIQVHIISGNKPHCIGSLYVFMQLSTDSIHYNGINFTEKCYIV